LGRYRPRKHNHNEGNDQSHVETRIGSGLENLKCRRQHRSAFTMSAL
jgi:hypothetical protein